MGTFCVVTPDNPPLAGMGSGGLVLTGAFCQFGAQVTRAPLNNSLRPLRDLKRADARRAAQGMAVALFKRRNAADVRFSPRPKGLSGWPALRVALSRHGATMP